MHRFNFPRLAAVLVIAVVGFVACAQGPGTPELREPDEPSGPAGPPDTAPAFAVTVADQTYTEGEAISPLTLPEASGGNGTLVLFPDAHGSGADVRRGHAHSQRHADLCWQLRHRRTR